MGVGKGLIFSKFFVFQELKSGFQNVGQGGDQSGYVGVGANTKYVARCSRDYIKFYHLLDHGIVLNGK